MKNLDIKKDEVKPKDEVKTKDKEKKPPKKSKCKNKKTVVDGFTFDSKKEAEYWKVLKHREQIGEIENLRRQERYLLVPRQEEERPMHYVADFAYYDRKLDKEFVVDVKSEYTRKLAIYVAKRKFMRFIHGIKVIEVWI